MDDEIMPGREPECDDVVGEREEKRRKREYDIVEEREEKERPSQVMMPSRFKFFDHDLDDDSDDGESDFDPDDDDVLDIRPCSPLVDPEVWKAYYRQIDESEGFDIFDFPGISMRTPIVPLTGIENSKSDYEPVVYSAKTAIDDYNGKHDVAYEFSNLEKVNVSVCQGLLYYITFQVKNLKAAGDGDGDGTPREETFQAKVWYRIDDEVEVELCRPKPIKPQNQS